jgi:rhamnose utilization protein RhaD (predicted bifunctional aldolase and dehydrogenase)
MYSEGKEQLVKISSYAGARKDYVQGGGGNTSAKFDDTLMAIKASGYTLAEITPDKGYVTVNYQKILDYYNTVDPREDKDFEKESLEVSLGSVELLGGMENKRPSVEVGFHAFLKKCVIHTHAVYANILCCSEEGRDIAGKAFKNADMGYVFIPYIDPGFRLTLAVKEAVDAYKAEHGAAPSLIFLDNHGVIAHGDSAEEAIAVHEAACSSIKDYLGLKAFPAPAVKKTADGFASDTPYLKDFMAEYGADEAYFGALKIYPDQLVYLGGKMGGAIRIRDDEILYSTGEKEAQIIEETLLGVAYVIDMIAKAGLTLKQMDDRGADFINNWESEKYRSQLIK